MDPERFTFTAVARLELDDLLEQLIERAGEVLHTQGRLRGLLRATQAISSGLDLPVLLQRIVEEARTLVGARYAALGVIAEDGTLSQFVHTGMPDDLVERIGHLPSGQGLLGQLIADPRPLRLTELATHTSSVGFPPAHPPMHSFLGVPVRIRGRVFGNLYLTEKLSDEGFTADDEELVLALASAAAASIDNATLFEELARRQVWMDASRDLTNALIDSDDRDTGLQLVTRRLLEVSSADGVLVAVPDRPGAFVVAAAEGLAAPVSGVVWDDASAAQVLSRRTALLVDDAKHSGELPELAAVGVGPMAIVPLSARGQALGALVIGNRRGGSLFDDDDLALMADFANQAALVLLESARQATAHQLSMSEERARIARDLHDHSIQSIFAVGLSLNGMANRLPPVEAAALIDAVDRLDDAIRSIRGSIFALRHVGSETPGVRSLLTSLTDELAQGLGFSPTLEVAAGVDGLVSSDLFSDIVAVVREALSNVARHANATGARVRLQATGALLLEVEDNGRGLVGATRSSGLRNMQERAAKWGGRCDVSAGTSGTGTRVRWEVPLGP